MHCQNNFVARLSLSEDKYNIIKLPMDTGREPYLGLSQKGVYLASFVNDHLRVCVMDESNGHAQWIMKHDYDLNPVKAFKRQVNGPWILEDINYHFVLSRLPKLNKQAVIRYRQKKKVVVQDKFEWNSDDDDFDEHEDIVEAHQHKYFDMEILGFHPYKEIIFLSRAENFKLNATGFAYHPYKSKSHATHALASPLLILIGKLGRGSSFRSKKISASFFISHCCVFVSITARM